MPSKITNPLKEGLPAKVYFYAFGQPISRYGLARIIYDIPKGHIPPTAKVSNVVRDMIGKHYDHQYLIEPKPDAGVLSNIEPLVIEFEKELPEKLTTEEHKQLSVFLDTKMRAYFQTPEKKEGDINAYTELRNAVGMVCLIRIGVDLINHAKRTHNTNPTISKAIHDLISNPMNTNNRVFDNVSPLPLSLAQKLVKHFIPENMKLMLQVIELANQKS